MNIGDYLREKRIDKGFSQRQLSLLSGVSNSEISRIEAGERRNPSPGVLRSLAVALSLPYEGFLAVAGYVSPEEEFTGDASGPRLPEWVQALPPDLYDFVREDASQGWAYTRMAKGFSRKDLDPKELEALVRTWVQAKRGRKD